MAKKQVTENQVEQLVESIIEKMQKANELFLTNIGEKIKKIRDLKPSQAHQLIQILKYGGNYDNMIKKISKIAEISINDLDDMFKAYSIKDQRFAEDFYKYRNIPFVEYNKNSLLKQQTETLRNIAKKEMYDFTRDNVLGYTVRNEEGVEIFKGLRQVYNDLLDEAFINVGQGKETFDGAMRKVLKDIGQSGLKTLEYESIYIDKDGIERHRTRRLDSVIRMHLKNRLNELHNENQVLFGEQFKADGVEISVHEYPAPDHELAQGRQFSNEEYEKLQDGLEAIDYKGNTYTLDHDGKGGYRPISEMNCYHTIFSIILGVSEPEYTDEQLKQIQERNDEQFEFDGKLYNKYEGTQLQRGIEREIRKQKDIQILAKASDNKELMADAQEKITILNYKYKDLCDQSGLPSKKNRMKVSGYQRTATNRTDNSRAKPTADLLGDALDKTKIPEISLEDEFYMLQGDLGDNNIYVDSNVYALKAEDLRNRNLQQLYDLSEKYKYTEYEDLDVTTGNEHKNWFAWTNRYNNKITFNYDYYNDKDKLISRQKRNRDNKWNYYVSDDKLDIYTITHEYGHSIENDYIKRIYSNNRSFNIMPRDKAYRRVDADLQDLLISNAKKISGEKMGKREFKEKYFSGYGKSKRNFEWFAELFAQHELGEWTPLTQALDDWLKGTYY